MSDDFAVPVHEYVDRTTKALVSTKAQPPIRQGPEGAPFVRRETVYAW